MESFHVQHTLFAVSVKRKYIKKPFLSPKEKKVGINQPNRFQTSGRGS